jgi:hypothetical protein
LRVDKPHGDIVQAPRVFNVRLHPELADLLERYAASGNVTEETIIAEAVRAYLGAAL